MEEEEGVQLLPLWMRRGADYELRLGLTKLGYYYYNGGGWWAVVGTNPAYREYCGPFKDERYARFAIETAVFISLKHVVDNWTPVK